MKVSVNWIRNINSLYKTSADPMPKGIDDLVEKIGSQLGAVDEVIDIGKKYSGIVVVKVVSCEKHPNADKLSVCRVADGRGERQIVCGAKNYAVGDKVPLILPEHTLPAKPGEQPLTIRAGKIRGVESQGMLCSPKELGLAAESDGLLILPDSQLLGLV